jgi:hypothetical protein
MHPDFDHLPVEELPLSVDACAALRRQGVATVGALRRRSTTELAAFEGLPDGALGAIDDALASCGLALSPHAPKRPGWPRARLPRRTAWLVFLTAALTLASDEILEGASFLT